MWSRVATAALLGLTSTACAQTSSSCNSNICYALNIPESTANSGSGDIFFQITAPSSYSWVGLGQGSSMSGSNMFVMYTSADGSNVTVSPRLGTGHNMPQFNSNTQITLLEGSGVSNGQMTANVRCGNCQSWAGGSMDFTASSAIWIHASRSGSAMNTDDTSMAIQQHGKDYGSFDWDFSAAKGGSSVNPFASRNATSTGGTSTGTQDSVPRPSSTGSGSGSSSGTPTSTGAQDCVPRPSITSSGSGSSFGTSTAQWPPLCTCKLNCYPR
ncbi:DOMON domain protein [Macrophomina phaseolina MS6]|uniref:DOMON domain protein n=1 Tax=Macrophomina phaseolina (strain MS6) TaxID=1126212 RepID=K2S715_MACPH|nr:DOMON domain protein [Macrophomina phaseolina MS6]